MKNHNYYVYITTNTTKSTLYTGVTNNLHRRVKEHYINRGNKETFVGKYYCFNLLYYERFNNIEDAIIREKQIKRWRREKKNDLINKFNPDWRFLNKELI